MANEPKSPISAFAALLEQQPALKSKRVPVFAWRKSQAKNTAAPRIVIYPTKSGLPSATSIPDALCDVDQVLSAECWGADGDGTWALMTWLIQALESQGIGDDTAGPGYHSSLLGADWETAADTTAQGEVVTVLFQIRLAIAALPYDLGHLGAWPTGEIDAGSQDSPAYREVP